MKAGTGAQLAHKPDVDAADRLRRAEAQAPSHHRRGIRKAIEIMGDREMLGEVALPGRNDAAPGLRPAFHRLSSHSLVRSVRRLRRVPLTAPPSLLDLLLCESSRAGLRGVFGGIRT